MEIGQGASSIITDLGEGWVRKTTKIPTRKDGMPLKQVYKLHCWSHRLLSRGYEILYTPSARELKKNSYEMEKIVPSVIEQVKNGTPLAKEIINYIAAALKDGIVPQEFELYQQPDGKVALLDFDRYGTVKGDKALFWYAEKLMPLKDGLTQDTLTDEIVTTALMMKTGGSSMRKRGRTLRRRNKK
jgi:hypothetical protein